jgi:hypothetical protein
MMLYYNSLKTDSHKNLKVDKDFRNLIRNYQILILLIKLLDVTNKTEILTNNYTVHL